MENGLRFRLKAIVNKRNGQINFSLPKKKISKDKLKEILSTKDMEVILK